MNILIIKLGAIGDVIRTTSILPGLKEKYENCKIDWATKKESFEVLKNNRLLNNIYLIENRINKKYDLLISLDDDYEACKLASKISSNKIIGAYLKNNKIVYTKDSALWFDMGLLSRYGKKKADKLKAKNKKTYQEIMYKILNLNYKKQEPILILDKTHKNQRFSGPRKSKGFSRESLNFTKKFAQRNNIKKTDLVIGVNTGAGGRWQDKKLSIDKTAELIDKLNNKINNRKILLFGGPEEKERNKKIKDLIKTEIIEAGCDNSLMEFASLINLCKILVTSDSLALHIGTALRKKIVCYFYPTSASEIELYGRGIKIIWKGKSYCSYQTKCKYPPEVKINKVIDAVKGLI